MLNKTLRDKLSKQALSEITVARLQKNAKITNWNKNENMYYGKKEKSDDAVANVDIGKMQEHVHTWLSKVDSPLRFKYAKGKEADLKKANYFNSLRDQDANNNDWDFLDLLGKKQSALYGRAIFSFHIDSEPDWEPCLENVDAKTFLIDRRAGGYDIEKGYYLGHWGVSLSRTQLKDGVKSGIYVRDAVATVLEKRQGVQQNQEDVQVQNRYAAITGTGVSSQTADTDTSEGYKFWRWITTLDGIRYYLIMDNDGNAIRAQELKELFGNNLYPYWTYAVFPDMTEFWTPSVCDYVREIFLAQAKSINQMLDNSERINQPQRAVLHAYVKNPAQLKYKRGGVIDLDDKGNPNIDVNRIIQTLNVPSINTPLQVYDKLDMIASLGSGVTNDAKGVSKENVLGIYEGNQANIADRFGLFNKSYSYGYKRFARLYYDEVLEKMTKKVSVEIFGADGVEFVKISRRDLKPYGRFRIMVEASDAETQNDISDKKNKLTFISQNMMNPIQSPKKAYEISARIANFTEDEVKELMDTDNFGNMELLSEAALDIERTIRGEAVRPNSLANPAYLQKIHDFLDDNFDTLSTEEFARLTDYYEQCKVVSEKNVAQAIAMKAPMQGGPQGQPVDPNQPPTAQPQQPNPLQVQPYQ